MACVGKVRVRKQEGIGCSDDSVQRVQRNTIIHIPQQVPGKLRNAATATEDSNHLHMTSGAKRGACPPTVVYMYDHPDESWPYQYLELADHHLLRTRLDRHSSG